METSLLSTVEMISLGILGISFVFTLIRLIKGPTLPDRVVAIDLITTIFIGVIVLFVLVNGHPVYLDVAGTLALVAFLGTIAFAYHLEKEKMNG